MSGLHEPPVSVMTPVYNGEPHIAECIESVLAQTYSNFTYTIVDNCSTDNTVEIAEKFARRDSRIRIHNNTEFLGVVENHNRAFGLVSEDSKYCKIVGADDWLFPQCIAEMVNLAEAHPTIGMVSSYVLLGSKIGWDGLPYPSPLTRGRDICRKRLLEGLKVFGGPSASLISADVVRANRPFYKPGNYHGDNSAYLNLLRDRDFGFVHQVLSFNRRGQDSKTTSYLQRVNSYLLADIEDLIDFGPVYLTDSEIRTRLKTTWNEYYRFLASKVLEQPGPEFWSYHRNKTQQLGRPIRYWRVAWCLVCKVTDNVLNPKRTIESLWARARG